MCPRAARGPSATSSTTSTDATRQALENAYKLAGSDTADAPPPAASSPATAGGRPWEWFVVQVEQRLEADLPTIALTVVFISSLIAYERGVQSLLDNVFGEGPKGSIACALMGLFLVFGVRLSGVKWTALWDLSDTSQGEGPGNGSNKR